MILDEANCQVGNAASGVYSPLKNSWKSRHAPPANTQRSTTRLPSRRKPDKTRRHFLSGRLSSLRLHDLLSPPLPSPRHPNRLRQSLTSPSPMILILRFPQTQLAAGKRAMPDTIRRYRGMRRNACIIRVSLSSTRAVRAGPAARDGCWSLMSS